MAETSDIESYGEYLRELQRNRGLKQFEFAKLVGRSPAWYSQILNGRRRLRPEIAHEIADRLSLTVRERNRLLSLVERELGPSRSMRERPVEATEPVEVPEPDDDFLRVLGGWQTGAILELARCEGYVPEPSWVGATLRPRVATAVAQESMEALRAHGYLDADYRPVERQPSVHSTTGPDIHVKAQSRCAATIHEQTLRMAVGALRHTRPTDRLFATATVALSEEDYEGLRLRLYEVLGPVFENAARQSPNRVYQVNLAVFPASLYSDSSRDPRTLPDDDLP